MNRPHNNQSGFTLIETIIYIALFSIIIGGGMVATFQIIQATNASYNHVILQEEANFLLRKINWALTGATTISANGSTLTITKPISGSPVLLVFNADAGTLTLSRNGGPAITLNSASVTVNNATFTKPGAVNIQMTLTTYETGKAATQTFSITKYPN